MKQKYRLLTADELKKPLPKMLAIKCKRGCPSFDPEWRACGNDTGKLAQPSVLKFHDYGVPVKSKPRAPNDAIDWKAVRKHMEAKYNGTNTGWALATFCGDGFWKELSRVVGRRGNKGGK